MTTAEVANYVNDLTPKEVVENLATELAQCKNFERLVERNEMLVNNIVHKIYEAEKASVRKLTPSERTLLEEANARMNLCQVTRFANRYGVSTSRAANNVPTR